MRNKLIYPAILVTALVLCGCGTPNNSETQSDNQNKTETEPNSQEPNSDQDSQSTTQDGAGSFCAEKKITLPNYGDPGHQLKNCFVEYPGEPSRQDKSYYIVEDICGQFTQKFVENLLGQPVTKIEPPQVSTLSNCSYYLNDKEYVMIVLDYLKIENQKIGQEAMDRKMVKESQIPMDNYVAYQEDGNINSIYLILNPDKFLSLQRSSKAFPDNAAFLGFAAKLAAAIKNYK